VPLVYLQGRADLRTYFKDINIPAPWDDNLFLCLKSHLQHAGPTQIRSNKFTPFSKAYITQNNEIVQDAGWHFSWMGDLNTKKIKPQSFIHYTDKFDFVVGGSYNNTDLENILNTEDLENHIPPSGEKDKVLKTIATLINDKKGRMWTSTFTGIVAFDLDNNRSYELTQKNGLSNLEFNYKSAALLPDGKVIFGGLNSYDIIDFNTLKESVKEDNRIFITGIEKNKIDQNKIINVAKIVNMHNFIIKDLPNGYDTILGGNSVRLSGGQTQCIGIARALYSSPKLLILDEATSALDNITEKIIMNNINSIKNEMTIILIAHRLHILKDCDNIFILENGIISGEGNYGYLEKNNKLFHNLINSIQ
jgi:hypothetical protein